MCIRDRCIRGNDIERGKCSVKRQAVFYMVLLCAAVLLPGCGAQDESAGQGTASSGVEPVSYTHLIEELQPGIYRLVSR